MAYVKYVYFIVWTNAERLSKAAGLIDAGAITSLDVKSFPFGNNSSQLSKAESAVCIPRSKSSLTEAFGVVAMGQYNASNSANKDAQE